MRFLALLLTTLAAQAATISFDELNYSNLQDLPGNYGSTSTVNVSWRTLSTDLRTVYYDHADFAPTGYGDLLKVARNARNAALSAIVEMRFEAKLPGETVTLKSFDLGGYSSNKTASVLRILDGSGSVLLDYVANNGGAVTVLGGSQAHSTFTPNITGSTLVLQFGDTWALGIDNITYSDTASAVPEPGTVTLAALGTVLLFAARRW